MRPFQQKLSFLRLRFFPLIISLLGLILSGISTSPMHPLPTTAQSAVPFPPEGEWFTYANGDDVLVMAREGDVLWAGTRAGGLVRWDLTHGTFVQFLKPQDGLVGNTIRDIFIDAQGHKWLATDHGLSVLDDAGTATKDDDMWFHYTRETTQGRLPSNHVTAVAMDEAGFLWIGMRQYWDPIEDGYVGGGLAKVDTRGNLDPADDVWLQTYTLAGTRSRSGGDVVLGLASDNIVDILPVPGNRVWIATDRHWEFRQFDSNPGSWQPVYGGLSRLDHAGTTDTADDDWETWTCESGPQRHSAVGCVVYQLALDTHGYVWAAMRGRGVIAFPHTALNRNLGAVQFRTTDGLPSNDVRAIALGSASNPQWQNTVWVGTERGIAVLDHQGSVESKVDDVWNARNPQPGTPITTESGLPTQQIQALALGENRVWISVAGSFGHAYGILPFDLSQRTFQPALTTAQSGLPYNYITEIAVGEPGTRWENQVWVATGNLRERKYGQGVFLLDTRGTRDPSDDIWTQFTRENTDPDRRPPWTGLASNNVTDLVVDGDSVWMGALAVEWDDVNRRYTQGGLSVYDGQRWTARTAENTGGFRSGLRDNRISALTAGCRDDLWIALGGLHGNSGLGISQLRTAHPPHDLDADVWSGPVTYNTIPSNLVTDMAADCSGGHFWIATVPYFNGFNTSGGGVARFDYATGGWMTWTASDGLETYAQSGSSGQRITGEVKSVQIGPDGTLWAGTWGTRSMTAAAVSQNWPYMPAVINWFRDGLWSNHVFEHDGWISAIAVDGYGVVWAGTSRGGLDFDGDGKEDDGYLERAKGGLKLTVDGQEWLEWTPENSPLPVEDIETITIAADGTVWIGTNGWGVVRFQPRLAQGEPPTPTPTETRLPLPTTPPPTVPPTETPAPTSTVPPTVTPARSSYHMYLSLIAGNWMGRSLPAATGVPPSPTPTASPTFTPIPTATATVPPTATLEPPTATPPASLTPLPTHTPTLTPTPLPPLWCPGSDPACAQMVVPAFPARDLYAVTFADAQHGIIVGEAGFVARTGDGGDTWTTATWGAATFRDVVMLDAQQIFIVGDNRSIWHSTNGGQTFTKMNMPIQVLNQVEDFSAVAALSAQDVWVMGNKRGTVLRWDGTEWRFGISTQWTDYPYTDLAMPAPNVGWTIAATGHIYRYNGQWALAATKRAGGALRAIVMPSPQVGWAAGDLGVVMRFDGSQWSESRINRPFYGGGIRGLHASSAEDVWAVASLDTDQNAVGAIFHYHDGRWEEVLQTPAGPLHAIWMGESPVSGWAVGRDGLVLRYGSPPNNQ